MKRTLAIASLALLFDVAATGQQPMRSAEKRFSASLSMVRFISYVLAKAGVSGSLEYEYDGKCGAGVLLPDLPPIREPQTPYARNPAGALESMFSADGRMVVSQESNSTIRIVKTGVETDILQVRINHLSFNTITDPDQALNAVFSAPEVQSFMQTHGIGQLFNPYTTPIWAVLPGVAKAAPAPGAPAVSGELNDVTLAGALDYILKAFSGFWLYQDCKSLVGQRIVYLGFFPVPGEIGLWGDGQDGVTWWSTTQLTH